MRGTWWICLMVALALAAPVRAATEAIEVDGAMVGEAGTDFGGSIAVWYHDYGLGSFSLDVAIAAPSAPLGTPDGRVLLFRAEDLSYTNTINPVAAGTDQRFGERISSFDRDGDGLPEVLLVAVPGAPAEHVQLYTNPVVPVRAIPSGPALEVRGFPSIGRIFIGRGDTMYHCGLTGTGCASFASTSGGTSVSLGHAIFPAELNPNNALPELLVADPDHLEPAGTARSQVHRFTESSGTWSDPGLVTASGTVGLGKALTSGNLDLDPCDEIVVGDPDTDQVLVYGAYGGDCALNTAARLTGPAGSRAGAAVLLHDVNRDGELDLLVGAPGARTVFLVLGPASGWSDGSFDLSTLAASELTQGATDFGAPLELLPDTDADGKAELLIGEPGASSVHRAHLCPSRTLDLLGGGPALAGDPLFVELVLDNRNLLPAGCLEQMTANIDCATLYESNGVTCGNPLPSPFSVEGSRHLCVTFDGPGAHSMGFQGGGLTASTLVEVIGSGTCAVPDGGVGDAGSPDGGAPDGGAPDGGGPDGGAPDSGAPDSGAPDGGASEDSAGSRYVWHCGAGAGGGTEVALVFVAFLFLVGRRYR